MQHSRIGDSTLQLPRICLGGNVFGWTADENTSMAVLDRAHAAGLDFIDTADVYSAWAPGNRGGESETLIGTWMKRRGNRARVIVATKVGMEFAPDRKGLSRARILQAVDESLARLQTDHIDLYYAHRDDPSVPVGESLEAFDALVRVGKVREIGASNFEAPRLQQALEHSAREGLARYVVLQPRYNLLDRAIFEGTLAPFCRQAGIGVVPYYGLAAGFLSGKYRRVEDTAGKTRAAMLAKQITPRGLRILDALDLVARERGVTPAQCALAWLAAQPTVCSAIASATSVAQVDELVAAATLELGREDIARLDEASAPD